MPKKPTPKKQQAKFQSRNRHSKWLHDKRQKLLNKLAICYDKATQIAHIRHFSPKAESATAAKSEPAPSQEIKAK